ncbi:MAG: hypothetical protein CME71_04375 [Halobacteriovorax sp.]|nr:hypothetical protein [Halobacteriovorax sp.]
MKDARLVWSDEDGDLRKKGQQSNDRPVDEKKIELLLRRLTSGKGRAMIEITGLPSNKKWCKDLASLLKKSLGAGGAYKSDFIEVHVSEIDKVTSILDKKSLRWKKIGG